MSVKDICAHCGSRIMVSIFKGLGYCSENHRKILMGDK